MANLGNEPMAGAPLERRAKRGRTLFAPLFAAVGRALVFLPVFASGVFAVWVSRRWELEPLVALRNTALATGLHGGLVMLHFLRSGHGWRWLGLAQLLVTLTFAILVALRYVTGGRIAL
jgi:hypothetical protein